MALLGSIPGIALGVASTSDPVLLAVTLSSPGSLTVVSDTKFIASVMSDATGNITVTAANSADLQAEAAGNGGYVNFFAQAVSGQLVKGFGFSRTFVDGQWISGTTPAVPSLVNMQPGTLTAADRAAVRRNSMAAISRPGGVEKVSWAQVARLNDSNRLAAPGCFKVTDASWTGMTDIGEWHTASDMNETFTYGLTADSDIDVGVDGNNDGIWSVSGTAHVGNSRSGDINPNRGPDWSTKVKTQFVYIKWHWTCVSGHTIEADRWVGGWTNGADVSSFDHQCKTTYNQYKTPFQGPGVYNRSSVDYTKFGAAVSAFGFLSLGAQSGMSTNVKIHYNFTQAASATRYLCGSNALIDNAKRIFAGT
jgi:hypothetical protein